MSKRKGAAPSKEFRTGNPEEHKETDRYIDKILKTESRDVARRQVTINSANETASLVDENDRTNKRYSWDDDSDDDFEPTRKASASRGVLFVWGVILALMMLGGVIYFGVHYKYLAVVWPLGMYIVVGAMTWMFVTGLLLFFAALFRKGCCMQVLASIASIVMLLVSLGGFVSIALLDESDLLYKDIESSWNKNVVSHESQMCEFERHLGCEGWTTTCRFLYNTSNSSSNSHHNSMFFTSTLGDYFGNHSNSSAHNSTSHNHTHAPAPSQTPSPSKVVFPTTTPAPSDDTDHGFLCPPCAKLWPVAPLPTLPPEEHTSAPTTAAPSTTESPTPHNQTTEAPPQPSTSVPQTPSPQANTTSAPIFQRLLLQQIDKKHENTTNTTPAPHHATESPDHHEGNHTAAPRTHRPQPPAPAKPPQQCKAALQARIKHNTGPIVGAFVGVFVAAVIQLVLLCFLRQQVHEAYAYEA